MVCVLCVDSDSSDWSSSDEEGEVRVPRPSADMSLQAKWEWLTQQENSQPQTTLTSSGVTGPGSIGTISQRSLKNFGS